jgi:hypothetical protein
MSDNEEIWLDPGHDDPGRAAAELSDALDMRLEHLDDAWYVSTDRLSDSDPVRFWGRVEDNVDARFPPENWPDDYSVFSDFPLVWTVESTREGDTPLIDRTRVVFDRVAAVLPWRVALTRGVRDLIATYDPERGVREFPRGTPADGTGRDLWA